MSEPHTSWVICQLGAREHYAVARALAAQNALQSLITDAWVPNGHPLGWLRQSLRERFHPALDGVRICAWTEATMRFELMARLRGWRGWEAIILRNEWFQRRSVAALARLVHKGAARAGDGTVVFAYSYAAREILQFARSQGWRTVLGQIDPGPEEERIVTRLYEVSAEQRGQRKPAPMQYWKCWQQECRFADRIVVNSEWSRRALCAEGVAREKIVIEPVAIEATTAAAGFQRCYPAEFSAARPLRALFLGQVNLRKGAGPLFEAIQLLRAEPIEFWIVGPLQLRVPAKLQGDARVRWIGTVPRGEASAYYRDADVFLFPTWSDGFGMTQLEAQTWKLPVIASQYCGDVVRDGVNGLVLPEVSGKAIAALLLECLRKPQMLVQFSNAAVTGQDLPIKRLGQHLLQLF